MELSSRITDDERQTALKRLASSRDRLMASIAGVSEEQARFKPSPERWSILEYVDHLSRADAGIVASIQKALTEPAQPELMEAVRKKDRGFSGPFKAPPRGVNQAPANTIPRDVHPTLAVAGAEFENQRALTIAFARDTQAELRSHFFAHSVFGPLDCYQWLMSCAVHAELHSDHIEELKAVRQNRIVET
jgi:hypothetical protein